MIINDIADYLEINGIGIVGTDIYIGELPHEINNCISVNNSYSPQPNKSLDVYEQDVEFWSRSKNSIDGYNKLMEIQNLLHRQGNYLIGNYHIYFSNSISSISDMDRDVNRNKLYSLSMRFIYRPETLVS